MNGMQTSIKIMKLASFKFGYIAWHTASSHYHLTLFPLNWSRFIYLRSLAGPSLVSSYHLFGDGFFFFWRVCLNDDWAVPLINKVVNIDRSRLWTMYKSKDCKSKDSSSEVWVVFVWMSFYYYYHFFFPKDENKRRIFELQEVQLCWHFWEGIQPRSILQEPSELANQISLDNLLQRSAAFKSTRTSLPGETGCTRGWDLEFSLAWQGSKSGMC